MLRLLHFARTRKHELPLYYDKGLRQVRNSNPYLQVPIPSRRGAFEVRALSFDSLEEAISRLLERNTEVLKDILDGKKDVWKNQELLQLVEEYFENSLQTLDFCTALERCLKSARDGQFILQFALQQYEGGAAKGKQYANTLEELLKNLKAACKPFTEEFFQIFKSVHEQQVSMPEKVQQMKSKIDKNLKTVEIWHNVSSIIFVAAFATVPICSVVAAAMAAEPVASALAAASSIPLWSMGKWIDSLWKGYEVELKGQKEMIYTMRIATDIAINDLYSIWALVCHLVFEIEAMMQKADCALRDAEGAKIVVEQIKKKVALFMKSVEDLGEQACKCSRNIRRARTEVLQRIMKHPV